MIRSSRVSFRIGMASMLFAALPLGAQTVPRIMAQNPALNNLIDPPGYSTASLGALGDVARAGTGTQAMILIPGLGFGGHVFDDLMAQLSDRYRMYAVTLPGFAGTAAPPSPAEAVSFGEQTWTNGAVAAIEKLIVDEKIRNPILVGHWLTGTQVALRLALKHPGEVKAVVILSGAARLHMTDPKRNETMKDPEERIALADAFARRWFKTVTRETWDDNNFLPGDYAADPVRGLRLWREAARPDLHVWVRYLCEFNAQDITFSLGELKTPTLFLEPGLEGLQFDPGQNYMDGYTHASWGASREGNAAVRVKRIPGSRACLWFDKPEDTRRAILAFLEGAGGEPARP